MVPVLVVGIGVVGFALWVFLFRDGYAGAEEFPDSVEHEHLRRVAEARVAALCPGAIQLAEKERTNGGAGDRELGWEFWRRFAAASASVEEDPVAALGELRVLPELLEEALRQVGWENGVAEVASGREEDRARG